MSAKGGFSWSTYKNKVQNATTEIIKKNSYVVRCSIRKMAILLKF
jgi:hypothetical protein